MSSQSLANEPSSDSASQSSDSEDEQLAPAQVTRKIKRTKQYSAWTFRSDVQTDLLSAEGVPVDENSKLLSGQIRTRISHTQPHNVFCVVAFADMTKAITRLPTKALPFRFPSPGLYSAGNARST